MSCSSLRNNREIVMKDDKKNIWYSKTGFSLSKANRHVIHRSKYSIYKTTVILLSFNFGVSGTHVLKYSSETTMFLFDKTCQNKETRFLTKTSVLNIMNLKDMKKKRERKTLVQLHTYLLH